MSATKLQEFVIYRDADWYASFPSLVVRPDGEVLCAFRRAPERRKFGGGVTHADPNSWCMMVRSLDAAATWGPPETIWASPLAGNQDPCLSQLSDGTLLCSTFSWMMLGSEAPVTSGVISIGGPLGWRMVNLGVSVLRSEDGGHTWSAPATVDTMPGCDPEVYPGVPNRGACRGSICQLPDGRVLWPLYGFRKRPLPSEACVYASDDAGRTWRYLSTIAEDDTVHFHEPALYLCPSGKLMAFLRTASMDGLLAVSHSLDGGLTWAPWERTCVWGHPFTACRLSDGRAALIYGHRREPFGIRMRVLSPECDDLETTEEIVLRDDGGNGDLGYPWVALMPDGKILCAYYMNHDDGVRYIAGSLVEVH